MVYIYTFEDGKWSNKKLLGGKGSSLAQMTQLGLPVPPGFTITTDACLKFYAPIKDELERLLNKLRSSFEGGNRERILNEIQDLTKDLELPDGLMDEIRNYMDWLSKRIGRVYGDPDNPLLVSVRSGAPVSMPGMMDTILNLGLNDETVKGIERLTGDKRFALDAYRRFLYMYGTIALMLDKELFDETGKNILERYGVKDPSELDIKGLEELINEYKTIIFKEYGEDVLDPWNELEYAVKAVFRSWMNPRAVIYRIINNISDEDAHGTAVNIQAMVFGNMGLDSGTGVLFTRDVATGEDRIYGEFLPNAQGEDVVAGIRTPKPIEYLKEINTGLYESLIEKAKLLEKINRDVQDIEFTVERGKLYFLQARNAKMTPKARVKTAVDMALEGLISKEEALLKVSPDVVQSLLYPSIKDGYEGEPIAKGIPASPGAVSGVVVFDPDTAIEKAGEGYDVILVRIETTPDDVHGFYASKGILTSRGGNTSHAAVVARAMGKSAVVGAESIKVDYDNRVFIVDGVEVREGEYITIDGSTGNIYLGRIPTEIPKPPEELDLLLKWADEKRRLGVWANADLPEDAEVAKKFGAEGIGLLRIERMFREPERLKLLRNVILSSSSGERRRYMAELAELIKNDFKDVLKVMDGHPVIIRLIDPPLHEFLPDSKEILKEIYNARERGEDPSRLENLYKRVTALEEANPMMGNRGVRVGITHPEVYWGLAKAIMEATAELIREGYKPRTEIMIPQVAIPEEVDYVLENILIPVKEEVENRYNVKLDIKFGTMIETVRAALLAGELAKRLDFFSFGTNDLTQAVFSFSRDDVENKFMAQYLELGILKENPFQHLDVEGVGRLIKLCIEEARRVNPDIEIGICGEHGGDPKSIYFLHRTGLDYVSASPYRVLPARLAAAQAAIKHKIG
ncbi:MAG TPA: pyruvate, phosphate dikinase [Thermoprotei archaeon]|nr:pyruvate, phosphate dikinase [Thermoprotei archaeon]